MGIIPVTKHLRLGRRPQWAKLWLWPILLILAGCATDNAALAPNAAKQSAKRPSGKAGTELYVSAAFGPDGKLWRIRGDSQYAYVDHSSDFGVTFSDPVAVNATPQRIRANGEDRPQIRVDHAGHIWVTYAADAGQPWTVYLSHSRDSGVSFSTPVPLSDRADSARAFLATMEVDPSNRIHFFWHDARDGTAIRSHDAHTVSLFHASLDGSAAQTPASERVTRAVCECCRIAAAFDSDGLPVLFSRFVFPVNERDHGLAKITSDGKGWKSWRATDDNWEMNACPEHGPAFAIAPDGRYHLAWFSQGKKRQGLFYAWSKDRGKHLSHILAVGSKKAQAGHPALLALGTRVALAWHEFDGRRTAIKAMVSPDGGEHWSAAQTLAQTKSPADFPQLISDGSRIYLSWNSNETGYRLIALD